MQCFTHNATPAVATCKNCSRAVCPTCAMDSPMAVTCSEACAKEASDLHEMHQRAKRIYGLGAVKKKFPTSIVLPWLLFGILFTGFGIYNSYIGELTDWFSILFGLVSFFIAVVAQKRAKNTGIQY